MKQDIRTSFYSKQIMAKVQVVKILMKAASDRGKSQMEKLERCRTYSTCSFFFLFFFVMNKREQMSSEKK